MEADDPEAYWRLGDLPKGSTTLKDSVGSSASATKTPSGAGSTLYIGGGELAGGKTFNGTLDEIAYYGSELAAAAGGAAPGGQARACGPREGRILPHLGHRKLTALSAPELRDWLVELSESSVCSTARPRTLAGVSSLTCRPSWWTRLPRT